MKKSGPSRQRLKLAAEAVLEQKRRWIEEGIKYFEAYVDENTGESLQQDVINSLAKTLLAEGGNRSGKTVLGAFMTACHMTGEYPDHWKGTRFTQPTRGRIIGSDFKDHLGGVIVPELMRFFPARTLDPKKGARLKRNQTGVITSITTTTGSLLTLMSSEQDPKNFEGWPGHWLWLDEPQPEALWIASLRGMIDFGGVNLITMTPLECPWVHNKIKLKSHNNPKIFCVKMSTLGNPHLKKEHVEEFMTHLTHEQIRARIYGDHMYLSGVRYPILNPGVHFIKPFDIPADWPAYCIIDPHDRLPMAVSWAAIDPTNDIIFYDEMWVEGLTIREVCDMMILKESKHKCKIVKRIMDPNFGRKKYPNTRRTVKGEFAHESGRRFIFTDAATDDVPYGHAMVEQLLKYDPTREISFGNHPKLYFFDDLQQTTFQMLNYMYADHSYKETDFKEKTEKMVEKNKHFPDNVRYLAVERPKYYRTDLIFPKESRRGVTGDKSYVITGRQLG